MVSPTEVRRQVAAALSLVLGKNAEDWMAKAVIEELRARGLDIVDATGLLRGHSLPPAKVTMDADSTGSDRARRTLRTNGAA